MFFLTFNKNNFILYYYTPTIIVGKYYNYYNLDFRQSKCDHPLPTHAHLT